MPSEIEHKYLVKGPYKHLAESKTHIVQGYLSSNVARIVRVRIYGNRGFITVKGKSTADGLERYEFETEIPLHDAEQLLTLCEPGLIEKYRYRIPYGGHTVEVDEFLGDNAGLVLAEIEVEHADQTVTLPPFIGEEVTGLPQYYNVALRKTS